MSWLLRTGWRGVQWLAGGRTDRGFTLHRALLHVLGVAWWNHSLLYRVFSIGLLCFTLFHSACLAYNPLNSKIDNPAAFTVMMQNLVTVFVFFSGNLKLYMLFLFRGRLRRLVVFMEEEMPDDGMVLPGHRFVILYGLVLGSTAVGWIFNGLFDATNPFNGLLFDEQFPWDESQGLGLAAALQCQTVAAQMAGLQHFLTDTICSVAAYKLTVQIDRLKALVASLGTPIVDDMTLLKDAIRLHLSILK